MAFIQLTSPLILAGDPTLPNHAATKQYVDFKANNIDAAGFSSGLLNVMRLPALVGDVTMAAGSGTLVLTSTGVNPGTYTKVVLNVSGRITAGGTLAAEDMPNISWSKITSGLPTTLAGYGISNVIGMSGGTITGVLTSSAVPSASLHLVTKSYVDSMIQPSGDSLATGDIVRKGIVSTSPSGFLRANGGKVSKTTYSALYSILGDRYEVLLNNGVEMPFAHMERLNLAGYHYGSVASVTGVKGAGGESWTSNTTAFVTHNRIYVLNCSNNGGYRYPRIFSATLNADGSFGTFNYENFPTFHAQTNLFYEYDVVDIFFTKNKVWFAIKNGVMYSSTINADGSITEPTLYSNPPGWKANSSCPVLIKNRLYVIDYNFTGSSGPAEVVYSVVDANGNFSGFTSLGSINAAVVKDRIMDAFVYKNKLIVLAGSETTSGLYTPWYATVNSDGTIGSWTAGPTISGLPSSSMRSRAITSTNGIYIPHYSGYQWFTAGSGESAYSYQAYGFKVLTLTTDANGVPVSWSTTGVLGETGGQPAGRRNVAVPNRIYMAYSVQGPNYYTGFSGGLQSYKPYYDGTYTVSDPANFYLPDFTSKETNNTKYYVKT